MLYYPNSVKSSLSNNVTLGLHCTVITGIVCVALSLLSIYLIYSVLSSQFCRNINNFYFTNII